jgi:tetratricopeptide (TPR) repeat protein
MFTVKRNLERILTLLFLLSVFLLAIVKIEDTDTWTHLSFGKWIWEHKAIPVGEPFIFTSSPQPYQNWLFGFIYYMAYMTFNIYGVILLKAITITIAFYILLKDSLTPYKNYIVAVLVMTVTVVIVRHRFVERPDTFLMIFLPFSIFSLNAFIYDNKKYIFAVPLIHILWANSHTSLPLMVIPFGAFIIGGMLQIFLEKKGLRFSHTPSFYQIKIIMVIFLISIAASLISPYFIDQFTFGAQTLSSSWWKQEILELRTPTWQLTKVPYVLTGILMLSFIINLKRFSFMYFLLIIPFVVLSFSVMRFIFLLGIISAPVLSRNIACYLQAKSWDKFLENKFINVIVIFWIFIYALLIGMHILSPFNVRGQSFGFGVNNAVFPEGALKYLDKRGIYGTIFNTFEFGGYICWRDFPKRKAFIDGRGFMSDDVLEKSKLARERPFVLDDLEKSYGFDVLMLKHAKIDRDLEVAMQSTDVDLALLHPQWALVYWDDQAMVYLKKGGKYDNIIRSDEYRFVRPGNGLYSIIVEMREKDVRPLIIGELKRNIKETNSSVGNVFLGTAYNEEEHYTWAIDAFLMVSKSKFWYVNYMPQAYNGIAYANEKLGNLKAAIQYYKMSISEEEDASADYALGMLYYDMGDKENTIYYLKKTLEKNKDIASIYPILINIYRELGRASDANKMKLMYKDALAASEGEEHFRKGLQAYMSGNYELAVNEFKESVISNPLNPSPYSNIGYVYYDMGNLNIAYNAQRKALDIDPDFANAHYGLALIYKRRGDIQNEKKHLKEYLRIEPAGYFSRLAMAELEAVNKVIVH